MNLEDYKAHCRQKQAIATISQPTDHSLGALRGKSSSIALLSLVAASSLLVWGCGGGSGSTVTASGSAPPSAVQSAQLTGVAATGAALANADVVITNAAGTSPCTEATITTTALGGYTCTLKAGETAPFFIVVTDPTGNTKPLVSIATETPVAGTPLTINATPLTTAIVAQLNGGDALGVVTDKTKFVAADFKAIKANVVAQLKDVLAATGNPANYDPFTTKFTAATTTQAGDTADKVLDIVKITVDPSGKPALTVVGNDKPITIATKDPATATDTVSAPPTGVSDLSLAAQQSAKAFANCFALPVARRVVSITSFPSASGGPEVTQVAQECQDLVTTGSNANNAAAFKHNGYSAGQFFYYQLTSDLMTGAKFSVPEIMAFYPSDATNPLDRAVLNIRYVDGAGNPGNTITVASNIPGTSTVSRPTNWWLTGNGQDVDIGIKTLIRRQETAGPNTASNTWANQFRSGLNIFVSSDGPQSALYDSALVTGPGLPDSGLWWYKKPTAKSFVLADQRTLNPVPFGSFSDNCGFCYNFWLARTKGLTGADAATRSANPISRNVSQGTGIPRIGYTNTNGVLAATTNYPAENSYNGATGTRPVKGSVYTFSLYLTTNGTPVLYKTVKKTLLVDLVDPIYGINLKWNAAGPQTIAALDPSSLATNSIPVDWMRTAGAEQVKGVSISMTDNDDDNTAPVLAGATSVVATAPNGKQFTGIAGTLVTTTNSVQNGYRDIYIGYRMLDGTGKQSVFSYFK